MSKKRYWKVNDLVGLMNDHIRGHIPFKCVTNHDIASFGDFWSVPLDPAWPYGIPDGDERTRVTMKYEIESNIPIPTIQQRRSSVSDMTETMTALEVGQSFVSPMLGDDDTIGRLASAFGVAKSKFKDKMFISRKVTENNKPVGLRVWRVK